MMTSNLGKTSRCRVQGPDCVPRTPQLTSDNQTGFSYVYLFDLSKHISTFIYGSVYLLAFL